GRGDPGLAGGVPGGRRRKTVGFEMPAKDELAAVLLDHREGGAEELRAIRVGPRNDATAPHARRLVHAEAIRVRTPTYLPEVLAEQELAVPRLHLAGVRDHVHFVAALRQVERRPIGLAADAAFDRRKFSYDGQPPGHALGATSQCGRFRRTRSH